MNKRKKIKCDICNAEFKSKHGMKGHIATIHEGKKQFKCDICDTNFKTKHGMKGHIVTIHEGRKRNQM